MRITSIEIRVCQNTRQAMTDSEMRSGGKSTFDFLVITMKTDEGIEGHSFGFAGRGAEMAGTVAASALKPFFLGKDPLFREKHWQDFRTYDRWWNHVPIYSYGPFDICLYDIAAKKANLPLYKMLGACRDKVPIYASSFVLATPDDYAKQALEVQNRADGMPTSFIRRASLLSIWRLIGRVAKRWARISNSWPILWQPILTKKRCEWAASSKN